MKRAYMSSIGAGLSLLALAFLPRLTSAQTAPDTIRIDGDRVVIEFGEDGRRLMIDGRSLDREDGSVVLRLEPGDREVEIYGDPEHGIGGIWSGLFPRAYRFGTDDASRVLDEVVVATDPLRSYMDVLQDREGAGVRFGEALREQSEVARLDAESRRLAMRALRAEGAEREELEAELEEKLYEIFDRKLTLRQERIDRLQQEIEEATDALGDRRDARAEIVERRLRELLRQRDTYDWNW